MKQKSKITLQKVADEVGVSVATVSHVINRTRPVDINLREKIIQTIHKMGYNKDRSYHQKRKALTSHIGLILPNVKDMDLFRHIIQITETIANENGYTLLFGDSDFSPKKEIELVKLFLQKQVNGLILASVLETPTSLENIPQFNTIPTVLIDRNWENTKYDFIGIDNLKSSFDATNTLIRKGIKNIVFISLNQPSSTLKDREQGYKLAMQSNQLDKYIVIHKLEPLEDVNNQIENLIYNRKIVESFFCFNTATFYEVVSALKNLYKEIPENIEIISYDDSPWFEFLEFPISVIRQPSTEIGMSAINLLIQKLDSYTYNISEIQKKIIFPTEFVTYTK